MDAQRPAPPSPEDRPVGGAEARRFLTGIGAGVQDGFVASRTLLSFEEYMGLFF